MEVFVQKAHIVHKDLFCPLYVEIIKLFFIPSFIFCYQLFVMIYSLVQKGRLIEYKVNLNSYKNYHFVTKFLSFVYSMSRFDGQKRMYRLYRW